MAAWYWVSRKICNIWWHGRRVFVIQ